MVHIKGKLFWTLILLLVLTLVACGQPSKPGPTNPTPGPTDPGPDEPEPEPSPTDVISGVLGDWDTTKGAYVHFASFDEEGTPTYFTSTISSEGAFSVKLSEPEPQQLLDTRFCDEAEESPKFKATTISQGRISDVAEPQGDETGRIILGNNPEFFFGDSSEASKGDRVTSWWYSDQDVTFNGECEDIMYAISFEKGWNLYHTIVSNVTEDSFTLTVETGPISEGVTWLFYEEEGF